MPPQSTCKSFKSLQQLLFLWIAQCPVIQLVLWLFFTRERTLGHVCVALLNSLNSNTYEVLDDVVSVESISDFLSYSQNPSNNQ